MKTRSVCWQRLKYVLSHSCLTNDRLIPWDSFHGQNTFPVGNITTYHEDMMNMNGEFGIICGQNFCKQLRWYSILISHHSISLLSVSTRFASLNPIQFQPSKQPISLT